VRPAGGTHRTIISQALRVYWACAIAELSALGIRFDSKCREQLDGSLEGAREAKARRNAEKEAISTRMHAGLMESDETFAHIAGYTEGGAAFGVTWEEWETIERGAPIEPPQSDVVTNRCRFSAPRPTPTMHPNRLRSEETPRHRLGY
jgi:hypothetical protein